jgi:hypothetical protein
MNHIYIRKLLPWFDFCKDIPRDAWMSDASTKASKARAFVLSRLQENYSSLILNHRNRTHKLQMIMKLNEWFAPDVGSGMFNSVAQVLRGPGCHSLRGLYSGVRRRKAAEEAAKEASREGSTYNEGAFFHVRAERHDKTKPWLVGLAVEH